MVLKKKCGNNAHKKLAVFNNISNKFLNKFLMMYSLSLHYKEKHEKSVGTCSRHTTPLGGSCLRWQLSGWQLSGWLLSGWQLSVAVVQVAVVLGSSCAGGSCPGWQLFWVAVVRVAVVLGGSCSPLNRNKHNWQQFFCFLKVSIALNCFTAPPALPLLRRP